MRQQDHDDVVDPVPASARLRGGPRGGGRHRGRWAVALGVVMGTAGTALATPPTPRTPPPPATAATAATPDTAASPPTTAVPAESPLVRVAAVGASATHGFFAQTLVEAAGRMQPAVMDLGDALAAVIRTPGAATSTSGSVFFFQAPDRWGPELLQQALASRPSMVVGVDYLFWFGYGATGHRPGTAEDVAVRRARLDRGLALLEGVEGPLAVGDLPDMSAAVGGMLSARQVPTTEVRDELNRRIAEWAAERPEVTVVGLSSLMTRLQAGERLGVPGSVPLLKPDKLHPTADGLLVLAREILRTVDAARPDVDASMLELDHAAALERLRVRLAAKLAAAG